MEYRKRMQTGTLMLSMLVALFAGPVLKADAPGPLTKQELKSLIATAKTAGDHERLAQHFDARATELEAESIVHRDLAAQYRANPTMHENKHRMSAETAGHCEYFAEELKKASQRARQMAAEHRKMARQAAQ
jgi:hypothetical protein